LRVLREILFANQNSIRAVNLVLALPADQVPQIQRDYLMSVLSESRQADAAARRRIYGLQVADLEGWQVAEAYLEITAGNVDDEALKKAKELVAKKKAKERGSRVSLEDEIR